MDEITSRGDKFIISALSKFSNLEPQPVVVEIPTSSNSKPRLVVPALPDPALVASKSVRTNPNPSRLRYRDTMDHYTRLQILNKTNGFCLPNESCMLAEIRDSRTEENYKEIGHKVLTIAEFLAISLVRQPYMDVVAVSVDRLSSEKVKVMIARNEGTPDDTHQAMTLRDLIVKHLVTTNSDKQQFKEDYIKTILTWGSARYERRLTVLNHPNHGQGPKSAARGEKLLTIEKVMTGFVTIAKDKCKFEKLKEIRSKYLTLQSLAKEGTRTNVILRGDVSLLNQSQLAKVSLLSIAHAYLASIQASIREYYRARRVAASHAIDKIISSTLLADILGSSRIFEDLLEIAGDWLHGARFLFCRSLRKVGVYSYGIGMIYEAMTTCRGKMIREIEVEVLPSAPRIAVDCHPDWYEILRSEARRIGYEELTVPKTMLASQTDLKHYQTQPFATLHAELLLGLNRKMSNLPSGEIGVSKSCCATCTEGLSALSRLGCSCMVKSGHKKPYLALLPKLPEVDEAIVSQVKTDFENWLRTTILSPDSDVSDHEISALDSIDMRELKRIETPSLEDQYEAI